MQTKSSKNIAPIEEKIDENFVHKNLLDLIFLCSPKENAKARPFFINFVAKVAALGKLKLEFDLCLESAIFLLENAANEMLNEEYNEEKSRLILNLLKIWESEKLEKHLTKLIEVAETSPL